MPFAVHMFFDSATEEIIRHNWKELAERGISSSLHLSGHRPHLLLCVYDELDIVECSKKLKLFAEMFSPFLLILSILGILTTEKSSLCLVPTVNQKMLDIHAYIHQLLEDTSTSSEMQSLPGNWNPYCELALDIDPTALAQAIDVGLTIKLPRHCQIEEIGVVEYWPVKHLCSFRLGGG